MPYFVHPKPPSWATHTEPDGQVLVRPTASVAFNDPAHSHVEGYPSANNYARASGNDVANYQYAARGPHPSDTIVAYDEALSKPVYMDQVQVINPSSAGFSMAKTPEVGGYPKEYQKRGWTVAGHLYGYSTCHWLRHCTGSEVVGSQCSATLAGVTYQGYCFTAIGGSLECGYTSAVDDSYGESPVTFTSTGKAGAIRRCPTGSPAVAGGWYTSKRSLIGGCMVASDANYDSTAEVHVPAYCAAPADYQKGCLIPGALNFNPMAKQSGQCNWQTKGCMDSDAFNYNADATIADAVNYPCTVKRVSGCTLGTTPQGTATNMAGAVSLGAGSGIVAFATASVTNYNSAANANSGCIIAVEGCMDPNAANYNSMATINSNSWCIPAVSGCMNPAAPNYNSAATVNAASTCIAARPGCMDSTATNFDSLATSSTTCYPPKYGCLNPGARNPYCDSYESTEACTPASSTNPTGVTVHAAWKCRFEDMPPAPPAPPSPNFPPVPEGIKQTYKLKLVIQIQGDCPGAISLYGEPMAEAFAVAQGGSLGALVVDIDMCSQITRYPGGEGTNSTRRLLEARALQSAGGEDGAIAVEMATEYEDAGDMESAKSTVAQEVGTSRASLQASFGAAAGVTVLSAPVIEVEVVQVTAPPSGPGSAAGAIVGIVVGLIAALMIVGVAVVYRKRKAAKGVYPA